MRSSAPSRCTSPLSRSARSVRAFCAASARPTTSGASHGSCRSNGVTTVGVDAPVSHRYAALHHALRLKGRPIPTNDLWIAAIAMEHGLVLYTRDAHFEAVPGLALV